MPTHMRADEIQQAAKDIVISFASVGPNHVPASSARECFEGCNFVRWARAAYTYEQIILLIIRLCIAPQDRYITLARPTELPQHIPYYGLDEACRM